MEGEAVQTETGAPAEDGSSAEAAQGELTSEVVLKALKAVFDPELGINIVDLGLVYEVEVNEGHVDVKYSLTTMGCPIGPLIEAQMGAVLGGLPGFKDVETEMVFRPPWTPEMMSDEAKASLGYF